MRRQRIGYISEILEYRLVPTSVVAFQQPAAAAPVEPPLLNQIHHVFGTVQGTYSTPSFFGIDSGVTNTFQGLGNLPLFGQVQFQGTLQGPGNIAFGQANGEITLSNSQGTLSLELVGPIQKSFAPLPQDFQFSVVSGTGAFSSFQMTGTIHLVENSNNQTVSFRKDQRHGCSSWYRGRKFHFEFSDVPIDGRNCLVRDHGSSECYGVDQRNRVRDHWTCDRKADPDKFTRERHAEFDEPRPSWVCPVTDAVSV